MSSAAKKLMEEALALPAEERRRLGTALLASVADELPGDDDVDELSEEWKQEIARRVEQLRSGEVKAIPGAEVDVRIRAALERARRSRGDH